MAGRGRPKKVFTSCEVSRHNSPGDLWIVIDNKVDDISEFVYEHPGGDLVLYNKGGEDATEDFHRIGHSESAMQLMSDYCICKFSNNTSS
ncbi:cytochrome b5-like [Xenia sp. Carnegie-2017]|uniref:cytochrome b5-like n=1 Tax=Xenia sp. Carnegie-2017 TaxID=2897299 RepID=UPI001F036F22|nr:cytochrome b5-like [Xenia sp. Carnegie-2017]